MTLDEFRKRVDVREMPVEHAMQYAWDACRSQIVTALESLKEDYEANARNVAGGMFEAMELAKVTAVTEAMRRIAALE